MTQPQKTFRISTVAQVAGVPITTVREWIESGVVQLNAPQTGAWRAFDISDLMTIVAIAEVTRDGSAARPKRGIWYVLAERLCVLEERGLTREHEVRGEYVLSEVEGAPDLYATGQELAAERSRSTDTAPVNPRAFSRASLFKEIAEPEPALLRGSSWHVVDVIAVWKRTHQRLADVLRGEP